MIEHCAVEGGDEVAVHAFLIGLAAQALENLAFALAVAHRRLMLGLQRAGLAHEFLALGECPDNLLVDGVEALPNVV